MEKASFIRSIVPVWVRSSWKASSLLPLRRRAAAIRSAPWDIKISALSFIWLRYLVPYLGGGCRSLVPVLLFIAALLPVVCFVLRWRMVPSLAILSLFPRYLERSCGFVLVPATGKEVGFIGWVCWGAPSICPSQVYPSLHRFRCFAPFNLPSTSEGYPVKLPPLPLTIGRDGWKVPGAISVLYGYPRSLARLQSHRLGYASEHPLLNLLAERIE